MRGLIAALVAVLSLGAAPVQAQAPAPPEGLIADLVQFCMMTEGQSQAVATRAGEAGYSPMPDAMLARARRMRDPAGFLKTDAAAMRMVMTAHESRGFGGRQIAMRMCAVAMEPYDARTLNRDLEATLGHPPLRFDRNIFAWVYGDEGRAPIRDVSDRGFLELIEAGGVRMIGIERRGRITSLIYLVPEID